MNNNDSRAPSEPLTRTARRRKWLRRAAEATVFILLFVAISVWLGRHMLDRDAQAPNSRLTQLSTRQPTPLSWPSSHERTLVYFFAPWCSVCRISMPGLTLLETDDQHLRVVAVALDWQDEQEVRQFISDTGFSGEVLLGTPETSAAWKISGYPSYYVVGKNGNILHADRGVSTPPGLWLRTHF
tara:strand:+ start:76499 stop:77050 length:552 start_codon:yes stop_codon:yes gene_type:complete